MRCSPLCTSGRKGPKGVAEKDYFIITWFTKRVKHVFISYILYDVKHVMHYIFSTTLYTTNNGLKGVVIGPLMGALYPWDM